MKKFTLVEILIAVAIIGILVGMTLGITTFVKDKIARTSTQSTLKLIEMAIEKYKSDFGNYPLFNNNADPSFFVLKDMVLENEDLEKRKGEIWGCFNDVLAGTKGKNKIRGIRLKYDGNNYKICDGWENPIFYIYPGIFNTESYDLISLGKDKIIGTSGGTITNRASLSGSADPGQGDDITNFTRN